jgi:Transcriptional regulator
MNTSIAPAAASRGPATHDVRDQIVVAATEHFSHYGYEKTTVSDLAKAIGFSKAYVYKFFESKQAIGEAICSNCLSQLEQEIRQALEGVQQPAERLRKLFKASTEAHQRLFSQDRKLYEIAQSAAAERWPSVLAYEARLRALLQEILQQGRDSGDFERKTPLDETTDAIHLVLRPYLNPLLLPHSLDHSEQAPMLLCSLVLRSLSP